MKLSDPTVRSALAAGAAGGVAEMLWIGAYASTSSLDGPAVAQQVATTVFADAASVTFAPLAGVAIHMLLSVALGLVLAKMLLGQVVPRYGNRMLVPAALAALAGIWAVNFLALLPLLNAPLVTLLPLAV